MWDNLQKQVSGKIWELCFSLLAFMQFSVRDQGDLAKTELRLSIITILHELMNILNYTAGNTFCLPRGKSGFFFSLIWETLTFRTAWFLVFSGFIWDCLRVKFGFLFKIFHCISLLMHVPLSFRCSENYTE